MYELIKITDACFYVESPARIGVVKTSENEVCLIDAGGDKDAGKKVKRLLDERGWSLKAIYNTHSHADHVGGNAFLTEKTGCRVYAPGIERDFIRHPILEPAFLYGAFPPDELRHKFLMAQPSDALELTLDATPDGWRIIPLPGHFFDMVGYRTPDDVVFLADCLSSERTLEKYRISFLVDVAAYLDTLERVKTMSARLFVPAHAEPTDDIAPLAQKNIDKVNENADLIVDICRGGAGTDAILKRMFDDAGLTLNAEQYALTGSSLRSYLTYLKNDGRVELRFEDNLPVWRAV